MSNCASCGQPLGSGAAFCRRCGAPVAPRGFSRRVTLQVAGGAVGLGAAVAVAAVVLAGDHPVATAKHVERPELSVRSSTSVVVAEPAITPAQAATPTRSPSLASAKVARSCGADGTGDCFVSVRASASSNARELRRLNDGDPTKVRCQTTGPAVYSSVLRKSSRVWSQLSSGGFVASVYLAGPKLEVSRRTMRACG